MPELILPEMKNGDSDVVLVPVQQEPWISDRVGGVAQDVDLPGGCVALRAHDGNLPGSVFGHIHHDQGVAVLMTVARGID